MKLILLILCLVSIHHIIHLSGHSVSNLICVPYSFSAIEHTSPTGWPRVAFTTQYSSISLAVAAYQIYSWAECRKVRVENTSIDWNNVTSRKFIHSFNKIYFTETLLWSLISALFKVSWVYQAFNFVALRLYFFSYLLSFDMVCSFPNPPPCRNIPNCLKPWSFFSSSSRHTLGPPQHSAGKGHRNKGLRPEEEPSINLLFGGCHRISQKTWNKKDSHH